MNYLPGWYPGLGTLAAERPFPEVVSQIVSHDNTVGGTMAATLPSGIVAGELLLIVNIFRTSSSISGWTTQKSDDMINVFWKIASGSEGSSVTISTSGGTSFGASVAYRIRGGADVEVDTPGTGSSTSPNPGTLAPSWGIKNTLWFAVAGAQQTGSGGTISVSAYPSGFSNGRTDIGITSFPQGHRIAVAEKQEKIASQNPGAFTLSPSVDWQATTIGVRPS